MKFCHARVSSFSARLKGSLFRLYHLRFLQGLLMFQLFDDRNDSHCFGSLCAQWSALQEPQKRQTLLSRSHQRMWVAAFSKASCELCFCEQCTQWLMEWRLWVVMSCGRSASERGPVRFSFCRRSLFLHNVLFYCPMGAKCHSLPKNVNGNVKPGKSERKTTILDEKGKSCHSGMAEWTNRQKIE